MYSAKLVLLKNYSRVQDCYLMYDSQGRLWPSASSAMEQGLTIYGASILFFLKPIILKIDQVLFQDTILQVIECGALERVLFLVRADVS
jgi:hypothetical protein